MTGYYIKRNDTKGMISCSLIEGDGSAADLSGASVKFMMRLEGRPSPKVNAAAVVLGDPSQGVVSYQWLEGDTDRAGDYEAEWQVTYADGRVATFPSDGYIPVRITADVG